ncbi:MAG: hypothetical protein ACREUM_02540, partial [Nitrosospira sp.]
MHEFTAVSTTRRESAEPALIFSAFDQTQTVYSFAVFLVISPTSVFGGTEAWGIGMAGGGVFWHPASMDKLIPIMIMTFLARIAMILRLIPRPSYSANSPLYLSATGKAIIRLY